MKVNKELEDAIAKHGEINPPKEHEDEFWEKVDRKKKEIGSQLA
jgi:hypothetical protein